MTFKTGYVYTHKNMLDVCMLVVGLVEGIQGVKMRVRWFKKNGLDLNALDDIFIPRKDIADWYVC